MHARAGRGLARQLNGDQNSGADRALTGAGPRQALVPRAIRSELVERHAVAGELILPDAVASKLVTYPSVI